MQYEGIPISEYIKDLVKVTKRVKRHLDNGNTQGEVFLADVERLTEEVEAFAHEFKE